MSKSKAMLHFAEAFGYDTGEKMTGKRKKKGLISLSSGEDGISFEPDTSAVKKGIDLVGNIVVGLLLVYLVVSAVIIVPQGSVGVRLEFGKAIQVLPPGIHLVVPVVNEIRMLSVQIEKYETDASAASKDLQIVSTKIVVNYQVDDEENSILDIFRNFRGNHANRVIAPVVQDTVKASTAKYTAEELITKRAEVKDIIEASLTTRLQEYGIGVREVSITNFDFSEEFNNAIEAKVTAEQNRLKTQIELEQTKVEVQKQVAQANATAISNVLEAEGEAEAVRVKAQAEADAVILVSQALEIAASSDGYLSLKWIQGWDGKVPTTLVGDDGDAMLWITPGQEQLVESELEPPTVGPIQE